MNLRELARSKPCMVRLPGCDGGGPTTVGAHYRSVSLGAGTSLKPLDYLMSWTCHSCHQIVDGVKPLAGYDRQQIRLAHAEGVLRTLKAIDLLGLLNIGKQE